MKLAAPILALFVAVASLAAQKSKSIRAQDEAETWVRATMKKMSLDEKVGQMLCSSFGSDFMATDSAQFDALAREVHEYHLGGFHVFGGTEAAPPVLLNATYGTVTLGDPFEAASTLNRLQAISALPLLNTADFETGAGFRLRGATAFPRNMAFGAAGDEAVMTAHIEMPALDPTPNTPTTLSEPIVGGVLRKELGFGGLIYTDSMGMAGVTALYKPGEAAVRAVKAGNDIVLHSPDDAPAFAAIKAAVESREISAAQIDAPVERILRAKAREGLHRTRSVNLEAIPTVLGSRAHQAVADEVSQRSMTLIKDARSQVPLKLPRDAHILYLSLLDYPSGWRIAAPSRRFIPELRQRWPNVTAIEVSERTTANELDLVRAMAPRFDAVVASVFVRATSGSGRMDLPAPLQQLMTSIARQTASNGHPFVSVLFGNPYTATFLQDVPAILLTYDFYDRAERSAVRALAGEAPVRGKLPI